MTVTGGEVNAISGTGDRTYGIEADTLSISGGDIIAKALAADSQSRGIKSNAVYAGDIINITDAKLDVTSKGNGIYSPYGTVNIRCTEVKASQELQGLIGTEVSVDASGIGIYAMNGLNVDECLVIRIPESGQIKNAENEEKTYYYVADAYENIVGKVKIEQLGYNVEINQGDGTYNYEQPDSDVTIKVIFRDKTNIENSGAAGSPSTGDSRNFMLYIGLMSASAVAFFWLLKKRESGKMA